MWSFFVKDPAKDFNYDVGEVIPGLEEKSIWKLHQARHKSSGELFSVFVFDLKIGSDAQMDLAKVSVKRLKTMRHPNILTYVDSLEGEKLIYLVTEYVEPLEARLSASEVSGDKKRLTIAWGIHQLLRALQFLNNDCGFVHHSVCMSSMFVNQAAEWKLGGVEYMTKGTETLHPIKIVPRLEIYDPPEKNDPKRLQLSTAWSADMWGLGCLIWEVFNGPLLKPASLKSPGKIPKGLVPLYCELVGANPSARPSPADFRKRCRAENGYMRNTFIDTLLFLEEIQIKDANEKGRFFTSLPQKLSEFPDEICKYKILPQLLSAFEFGGAGPAILTPLFKLGKLLSEEEYQKKIIPCVVKLFSSTDRATRAKLLQQLELFVDHLQANVINAQLFPELLQGFLDTNATIREVTVKSILHLASKLNYNNLNVELMKHLAVLQSKDPEGGIRTNTTVCLGKISHNLHPDTRKKVLVTAFIRAMRDPFPPARNAGILALAATQKFYTLEDISRRILPSLCQMTLDSDKSVRDQAFKAIKGFLGKLEKVSEDPTLKEEMESEVNATTSSAGPDSALGWAGWAVTSLTQKLYNKSSISKEKPASSVGLKQASQVSASSSSASSDLPATNRGVTIVNEQVASKKESDEDDSESEYEGGGDGAESWNDNWGEMDSSGLNDGQSKAITTNEGWDVGWDDVEFVAVDNEPGVASTKDYNWGDKHNSDSFAVTMKQSKVAQSNSEDSWDTEWGNFREPVKDNSSLRDEREQKRLQRRKEIADRRAGKQTGGPMKLGERQKF